MSCQIKVTANISNVQGIRRCLFPTDDLRGTDGWLQYCLLSGSPTGEIIAIAHEKRLVILTAKWDTSTVLSQYNILFSGSVDNHDPITAILCLPLVAQSQSSQVGPDWTCIVVGFESGYVRFYTENCNLLLEEQFHNEKVCFLKCQSQHHPRPDICPEIRPEEIYIHYNSNVCLINGQQLFPTLRNNRNQLARVQAKGATLEPSTSSIFPKKWGFTDQSTINDAAVVGLDLANSFDHLFTASTCGGFETRYRAMPPHNSLVLGVGAKPYVGFHYAVEGGSQPVLSDVAKAVASKLKSALPGWLTGGRSQNVDKQPSVTIQASEAMGCRFGLCDLRRQANTIIMSPDRKLAAVTDALGRVALIDTRRGITLRLLKGYREAQCAFLQVPDEKKPKHRIDLRLALFLIVYSPKKGTIEIFTGQQCSKIATFTASKHGRLLYTNYGLLGFGTTTSKSRYSCHFTCSLFDPDGAVKEVVVPFHFALTEKNSKQARDLHLLKRLKQFIRSADDGNGDRLSAEISNTCEEIKTNHVRLQLLEMLIANRSVTSAIVLSVVTSFQEKLDVQEQSAEAEGDGKTLASLCRNLNLLLSFYMFFETEDLDARNGNLDAQNGNAPEPNVETRLKIGDKDMNNLQRLLDLSTLSDNKKNAAPKVSFYDERSTSSICEVLAAFSDLTTCREHLRLKSNVDEGALFKAAEIVFDKYISSQRRRTANFDDFRAQLAKSTIHVEDLLRMALCYWVNRTLSSHANLETEMRMLSDVLYAVCQVADAESISVEYNKVSPFWSRVREILADSSRPFPALTAAVLCKGVAQRVEHDREMQQNSVTSLDDEINMEIWEKLSQDNCEWGMLIGKLEDVSLLNIILSNKPLTVGGGAAAALPKLAYEKIDISLKYILRKGKGSVSELVAQWLTTGGVDPQEISVNELLHEPLGHANATGGDQAQQESSSRPQSMHLQNAFALQESIDSSDLDNVNNGAEAIQPVFEHLNIIKKQFPYSLETSVLLSNMCWEYSLSWQKDISQFQKLNAAIRCLEYISDLHVKQGMFNLMWSTHLRHLFESSCKLINKVGKVPKERLCRQDTGMSDLQIAVFVETCTGFLDMFMDVVQQSFNTAKLQLRYEAIWDNGAGAGAGETPLTELAQQQSLINYDLLHLHYQLSLMMQMMSTFSIKHTKAMSNLFHNFVVGLFFSDLQQSATINLHNSDTKLIGNRAQFLAKVISASIETVTVDGDALVYSTDHVLWMSRCLALARVWNVDTDALRRYQVVQLFASGFDSLAAELLASVADTERIGPELLAVAGKRLSQFVSKSEDLGEKLSALSPPLTAYLDGLSGDWCAPSTITNITSVATHAIRCLNENQTEFRLATLLLDACATLEDMDDANPNLRRGMMHMRRGILENQAISF